MKNFITKNKKETEKLGKKIGEEILRKKPKNKAFVITLEGDLGGGKTTFVKGLAKGLGIKEKVLSPTFILVKKFEISKRASNFSHFFHIDCYRIEKPKEILGLGFKEITKKPTNIVAIEWANKIERIIPKKSLQIKFEFLGKNKRKILIKWQKDC